MTTTKNARRAYRLYLQYKTETREYAELAALLGCQSAAELNVKCNRFKNRKLIAANREPTKPVFQMTINWA